MTDQRADRRVMKEARLKETVTNEEALRIAMVSNDADNDTYHWLFWVHNYAHLMKNAKNNVDEALKEGATAVTAYLDSRALK